MPSRYARDPRAVERFNQEAQTGRALKHPNVVQLLDQGSGLAYPRAADGLVLRDNHRIQKLPGGN